MDNNSVFMLIGFGIVWLLYSIYRELKTIRERIIQWQLTWEQKNGIDHSDVETLIG